MSRESAYSNDQCDTSVTDCDKRLPDSRGAYPRLYQNRGYLECAAGYVQVTHTCALTLSVKVFANSFFLRPFKLSTLAKRYTLKCVAAQR